MFRPNFTSLEGRANGGQTIAPITIAQGDTKKIYSVAKNFVRNIELTFHVRTTTRFRTFQIGITHFGGNIEDTGEYSVRGDELDYTIVIAVVNNSVLVTLENNDNEDMRVQCAQRFRLG